MEKKDADFLKGMISHHKSAIEMSKMVLKTTKDKFITSLANGIIKAQEGEIASIEKYLSDNGESSTDSPEGHGMSKWNNVFFKS